jgi:hypothetical protein
VVGLALRPQRGGLPVRGGGLLGLPLGADPGYGLRGTREQQRVLGDTVGGLLLRHWLGHPVSAPHNVVDRVG